MRVSLVIIPLAALALALAFPRQVLAESPLAVEVVTVERATGTRSLTLTGEIAARDTLSGSFPVNGRIAAVLVTEGDRVKKGATLVRLEQVRQEQELRAAEAGLLTARADQQQAADDFARQDALLARGATTRSTRDEAADTVQVTEASVAQAEAERDAARQALADTVLLAPSDAVVTDRLAEVGQVVSAAQAVVELALGSEVDAVFQVPEVLTTRPRADVAVELQLLDGPQTTFAGEVREVSPLIDSETGTVAVKVGIARPPADVTYGAVVRGTVTQTEPERVLLPFFALTATVAGPAVWVVDPATQAVALRQVQVLRHETGTVVIGDGLETGEQVVSRGAQLLYPGRIIRAAVTQ